MVPKNKTNKIPKNTIARDELTENDRVTLETSQEISNIIKEAIPDDLSKKKFNNEYGKISFSRDAGQGKGGGKLQRDALCTRGRTANAPFSNRNLRWHPLVLSINCPSNFTKIDLNVDDENKKLIFIPSDNKQKKFYPEEVHTLNKPYCIPENEWIKFKDTLSKWSPNDWILNWCAIPILEYCPANFAIETYGILGLIVSSALYKLDVFDLYEKITNSIKSKIKLSKFYPDEKIIDKINLCPLCKEPIINYPAGLQERERINKWNPPWQKNKRNEGEDNSLQIMHVNPLNEQEINHNASNVRLGHRWCNVAMTDHSISKTIEFMREISKR